MPLPAAGNRATADLLAALTNNSLQFVGAAQTTASINMTGTFADLTGTSLTLTTMYPNTKINIWASFDVTFTSNTDIGAGGPVFVGAAMVDGVSLASSGEAHYNGVRTTAFQQWSTTLTAAGSHTIKLQGRYNGGVLTGNIQTLSVHTRWSALVFGP